MVSELRLGTWKRRSGSSPSARMWFSTSLRMTNSFRSKAEGTTRRRAM
jgi:hypothetical protein